MIDAVTGALIELFMHGVELAVRTFLLWKNRKEK